MGEKKSKDGKSSTVTIRISTPLRERIERVWKSDFEYSEQLLSSFLSQLIAIGLQEVEMRVEEKDLCYDKRRNAIKKKEVHREQQELLSEGGREKKTG